MKDIKGNGHDLMEVTSRHAPERTGVKEQKHGDIYDIYTSLEGAGIA
jgi:hypothetical protein